MTTNGPECLSPSNERARLALIAACESIDGNGVFSDADLVAEGMAPMTLEDATRQVWVLVFGAE